MSPRRSIAVVLFTVAFAAGCASAGARIKEKFPVGYERLASAVPECAEPSRDLAPHCEVAAEILQSKPPRAIELLLAHLETTGEQLAKASDSERRVIAKRVEQTVVPALRQTFTSVGDTTSKAALAVLDAIEFGSEEALDALRRGLATAKKAASLFE